MSSPSVFISYSHKDEEWKDRLVTHLGVLEQAGILDLWEDRQIEAGDDWYPEIEQAINKASVAILMISANFLTSKFILGKEVPKLLERREKEGVKVVPLIVKPCTWTRVKWLAKIQARPKDGRPLSAGNDHQIDTDLSALAEEIARIIQRAEQASDTPKTGETPKAWRIPPDKISLAKLPSTDPTLFGREEKLKQLDDAWSKQDINILSLVAWGGVGKTALVNKWLSQMAKDNYRGAARVYGWSFYSQGAAEGRQVSADQFIAAALEWFGDPDPTKGSPWDKGERLAELIKRQRTLLVLDGLEPLQNPPPVETGKIKDPGITSLLRELARQNPGLVVISTRLTVDDLKDYKDSTALEIDLENLSYEAGAAYLKFLGVDGTDDERKEATKDFGGHALALTLLGRYLADIYEGDIRKRNEIPHLTDEEEKGGHAKRMMKAYEKWFEGNPELDLLKLLGLFDRPAVKGAIDALLAKPFIEGLTNRIQGLPPEKYKLVLKHLRKTRLLAPEDPHAPDELDCHPLLREHFGEKLKSENAQAWREGNNRLYKYYKASSKEFPDTIQEMAPLYAAVMHGCQAGEHQEAFLEVYWKRIHKGEEYFAMKKLGAIGADLSVLSGFFELPWRQIVQGLHENIAATVLNNVGFSFRAFGRLSEAAQPMQSALETVIRKEDWKGAAIYASNLSELCLTIGDLPEALAYAEQCVEFADSSSNAFWKCASRTKVATALHQMWRLTDAQSSFLEAEEMQKKQQPELPLLYSFRGYQYCDLLLSQDDYAEVQRRAIQTLEWSKQMGDLLQVALDNLSLGRAHLLRAQREPNYPITNSLDSLNRAVNGLRQAGQQDHLPRGLLARAEYYRLTNDLERANRDLDEAFTIATRGGMGLFLADCQLEYARWYLAMGEKEEARKNWQIAKEKIEQMGYHRRDKEVEELEVSLRGMAPSAP